MMTSSVLHLLSPWQFPVGNPPLSLANRVIMAPLTRARANPQTRVPNHYMDKYYEMRSSAGLVIGETTAMSDMVHGWYGAPALYTKEHAEGWKLSVHAVHAKGGKMFAQLWHMGRQSHPSFHPNNDIVAPSAIKVPIDSLYTRDVHNQPAAFVTPRALETTEIPTLIQDYKKSATLATTVAGFDGIEIHSANGYLLDTFLQSSTNKRTDRYGGSAGNRCRLLLEILDEIRGDSELQKVLPMERVGIRVSPNGAFGEWVVKTM